MSTPYTFLADLIHEIEPPAEGMTRRVVYQDEHLKAMLFGFAAGKELPRHTSPRDAVLQVLQGEATLELADDRHTVQPGTWVHMPAQLPHSLRATTPVVMLLLQF